MNKIITEDNVQNKLEEELLLLNKLLETAVNHGGDKGGAYFTCPEEIQEQLNKYLKLRKLTKEYRASFVDWDGEYDEEQIYFAVIMRK